MATSRFKERPGELLQIVTLTLAMTGGGLMLLFLVLRFWMVPGLREEVKVESGTYRRLTELLKSDEMQFLREESRNQKAAAQETSLRVIIEKHLDMNGLQPDGFRAPRHDQGAEKYTQQVQAAPMRSLLSFVVGIQEAKKTVEVQSVLLSRPSRSKEPGAYTSTVELVDYAPPKKD